MTASPLHRYEHAGLRLSLCGADTPLADGTAGIKLSLTMALYLEDRIPSIDSHKIIPTAKMVVGKWA